MEDEDGKIVTQWRKKDFCKKGEILFQKEMKMKLQMHMHMD